NEGNLLYRRSADIESGLSLGTSWTTEQDELGRPTRIDHEDGTFELLSYSCCGLSSRTSREGIETTYEYDDLKRLVRTTTAGVGTVNVYDAAGNVIETLRIGSDDTPMTQSKSGYDLSG